MKKQPEVTDKTRQRFVDAFWKLAEKKPVSKITVSELTRLAGYNRSTFYEYFLDTFDLLSYVEDRLIGNVKQVALQTLQSDKSPKDFFRTIFMSMNEEIYLLTGPNGDTSFFEKVSKELSPYVSGYLPIRDDVENFDYLVSFVNSAMLGLLKHWYEKDKNLTAEEMSEMMQRLMLNGAIGYVQAKSSEEKRGV
ncbi:MAG: TetR family transcriptional regulator C-terminal domain-containing protein [Clostridia bacterium]|nr:TetR family transcriptional regulator C-terminal domain-containing protein [Clostridia bacterium]